MKAHRVLSIRITNDLLAALHIAAAATGEAPSVLARRWIEEGLVREGPPDNVAQQRLTVAVAGLRSISKQLYAAAATATDVVRAATGK